jgi:hypothetical protein
MCFVIQESVRFGKLRPIEWTRPKPSGFSTRAADRDEHVAALIDLAVVVLDEGDAVGQFRCCSAVLCIGDLFSGVVIGDHLDAVMLRHVQGQCAPAAARLDDFLPGLQLQFPAHVIELRNLCFVQRRRRRVVVGAGIHHAFVQPQPVEVVAEVVVVMNVVPRPAERIAPRGMQQRPQPGEVVTVAAAPRDCRSDLVGEGQEIPVDVDQTPAVALAEAHGRGAQQFEHCTAAAKLHASDGTRLCNAEFVAIPEPHRYAGIADGLHDAADYAAIEAALVKNVTGLYTHGVTSLRMRRRQSCIDHGA